MCLTRREQPAREQLIDRENDGVGISHMLREPAAHFLRFTGFRVIVHILRGRRYNRAPDDLPAVYDELSARRTRVERY